VKPRTIPVILLFLFALTAVSAYGQQPSDLLYVWAWDKDEQESDFLAVIDVNEDSPTYGQVVNSIAVGVVGYAHHVEHQMKDPKQLFVNSYSAGLSFVFDMSAPRAPVIVASFENVGPFAFPHSFERLDNGNVLATFQHSAERPDETGGLVELDRTGGFVRGSSSVNAVDPELHPYSLAPLPRIDRVVSTSADMMGEHKGRSIQVWRLSDLELLHTILLPAGPRGDENIHPSEVRELRDGKSVIVGTFMCGLYLVEDIDSEPRVTFLRSFPWSKVKDEDTDCNLPVRMGDFWVQTVGTTGSIVVLDLADPHQPEIVSEYSFGIDARPHWISLEPGGNRIVMTGGGTLEGGVVLLRIDEKTGALSLVNQFRSPNHPFGLSFDRKSWPHGDTGPAYAHGAVFRQMPR